MAESKQTEQVQPQPVRQGRAGMGGGMHGMRGLMGGKAKNFKKAWGNLFKFARRYYVWVFIAIAFAIASAVIQVIGPDRLGRLTNSVFDMATASALGMPTDPFMTSVVNIGTLLVILYAIMFVLGYLQQFIMATVIQRLSKRLRTRIADKFNSLPLKYFDKNSTGDVLSRITNDTDMLSTSLNQSTVTLVAAVTVLIGSIIMMFTLNWIMALVAVVSSFGGFLMMGRIMKFSQKHFIAQQQKLGALNGYVEEYYTGANIVKVCNANKQVNATAQQLGNELYQSAWKSQFFSGLMQPIMGFVSNFSYLAIAVAGGILVFNPNSGVDIGVMTSFLIYVRIFTQPMSQIAQAMTNLQSAAAASERVFDLLEEKEMEDESAITKTLETVKGNVKLDNIKFGYDPDRLIIKGFSADIKAGSKVAIVGPTGAGKTTIVNLLMKFYKTDSGDISIDGVPINELKRDNVHRLFSMVLQDTWLFEGTVRENLAYNVPDVTNDQLDAACSAAGIDHFIKTLPQGYDTVLNEQASMSNGQKQLLTIARAMIKNSSLLILDEATSSVDTRTEVLIQNAMDNLTKGRTSFVIAHRLSTIKNADIIFYLKDGDVVESGSHNQLIAKKGFYADLYNSQFTLANAEVTA